MPLKSSKPASTSPDFSRIGFGMRQIRSQISSLPKICKAFQEVEEMLLLEFREEVEQRIAEGHQISPLEIAVCLLDRFENQTNERLASIGQVDIEILQKVRVMMKKTE